MGCRSNRSSELWTVGIKTRTLDQCVATHKCHAADTRHGAPPRHSIHTRPCVCLLKMFESDIKSQQTNVISRIFSSDRMPP